MPPARRSTATGSSARRSRLRHLSGGQQARLQILLLELSGATLLLLDEPTDNLDLVSAEALEDALARFEGTVLAVTHDRWFAQSFDRFLVFGADGRCVETDAPVWDEARVARARWARHRPTRRRARSARVTVSMEIELGRAKRARRAYAFDDIAVVPVAAHAQPRGCLDRWTIDAFQFDIPVLGAPMDSVVCPRTAIMIGSSAASACSTSRACGPATTTPSRCSPRSRPRRPSGDPRMQELYSEPIKPELVRARLAEIRAAGVTVAGALTPQRTQELYETVVAAGVDLFVIRGTTVSAEHVSKVHEPLNLKKFIYDLDVPVIVGGAATYTAALHLMRTGAAGVLVGFGGGAASTTRATLGIHAPMATAVADVAGARRDYLDESGGRYVHVIADGGVGTSGDIVKAIAMRRRRRHARHGARPRDGCARRRLPLGSRGAPLRAAARPPRQVGQVASLEEILYGPAPVADGTANLVGALRRSMATTGYSDLKEFQRVEVVVAPVQRDRLRQGPDRRPESTMRGRGIRRTRR